MSWLGALLVGCLPLFFFFVFVLFFLFSLFLDRLRPWWLKLRSWPWASSWVPSEARHWRIWSPQPVSIRVSLFLSFQCNAPAALLSMHPICLFECSFVSKLLTFLCPMQKSAEHFPASLNHSPLLLICMSRKQFTICYIMMEKSQGGFFFPSVYWVLLTSRNCKFKIKLNFSSLIWILFLQTMCFLLHTCTNRN